MTTLYAWASPAFYTTSPVDHTWVTTYDNRQFNYPDVSAVAAAGKDCWLCWGDYRPRGGIPGNPTGYLGQKSGNLNLARCLVQPNADSRNNPAARGTIFSYGIDGVCHQLSNQVLYATTGTRLTVRNARGYFASAYLYGTYGVNVADWANKVQSCGAPVVVAAAGISPTGGPMQPEMNDEQDDFTQRATAVLAEDDPGLLAELLALHRHVRMNMMERAPQFTEADARSINEDNQRLLDHAAELLGPLRFQEIFGFPAGEKIDLVDPEMLAADRRQRE